MGADEIRDAMKAVAPEHGGIIERRDEVVERYCAEHGVSKDELTIEQVMEIRSLPEWQ